MHTEKRTSAQHICHAVELPDGRHIQITYLDIEPHSRRTSERSSSGPSWMSPPSLPVPATPAGVEQQAALHLCPACSGRLVHPLDWCEVSSELWRIQLRCPDCGLWREGVYGRRQVERLDEELDRASATLLSEYKRLVRANMNEELELLTRALELELIGPRDFQQ